ncbi:MAG: carboxypeptidase regulatory-like domain-containing protein [Gemmatimonadaceae bacterium]
MQSEHQSEESLHAWLDNELGRRESALLSQHVETCASCSSTLAACREKRATVSQLLQSYDHVVETSSVRSVARSGAPRAKVSFGSSATSSPIIGHIVANSQPIKLWSAAKHFVPIAAAAVLFVGSATFAIMRNYSSLTGSVKDLASEAQLPFVDVSGRVVREGGAPIANALVAVPGTGMRTRSDDNGYFSMVHVPRTAPNIVVRGIGFSAFTLPFDPNNASDIKLTLVPQVLNLEAVKISADSTALTPAKKLIRQTPNK